MGKVAFITGISGQDGSYLAELLLSKKYDVYGLVRRSSEDNTARIKHIIPDIHLITGDIMDQSSILRALDISCPNEIYHLAAMSNVAESFRQPIATTIYNALGTLYLLEAIKLRHAVSRLYNASTSEMFGCSETPQNEYTAFKPRSPYGASKLYAHNSVTNYREAYNIFACNGILFNHESPRRSSQFVSKKIAEGIAAIVKGTATTIQLGNIHASRDWGYAPDYVEAMWMMLQQDSADDYVIATGVTHTVEEFVIEACRYAGLKNPWYSYVEHNPHFLRPTDIYDLCGDPAKARRKLGWKAKTDFINLVACMIENELS